MLVSRSAFKLDDLGVEIATIALPAAMALTADPIASIIDTAFIGQIGAIISFLDCKIVKRTCSLARSINIYIVSNLNRCN